MKYLVGPATAAVFLLMLAFLLERYGGGGSDAVLPEVQAHIVTAIHAVLWFVGAWFVKRVIE